MNLEHIKLNAKEVRLLGSNASILYGYFKQHPLNINNLVPLSYAEIRKDLDFMSIKQVRNAIAILLLYSALNISEDNSGACGTVYRVQEL